MAGGQGALLPIEPRDGDNGEDGGSSGVQGCLGTGKPLGCISNQPHLDSQLSKKQAGHRPDKHLSPSTEQRLIQEDSKISDIKMRAGMQEQLFHRNAGSLPHPKGISELPELVVVL